MDVDHLVDQLEEAWDSEGFLGQVRVGQFSEEGAEEFLRILAGIDIDSITCIPRRFLSLIWYLPLFLDWQRERVSERGGNIQKYEQFITDVHNTLEVVLGVP
jgi:hypothetical protein